MVGKKIFDKINLKTDDIGTCLTDEEQVIFYRALTSTSESFTKE